MCLCRVVDVVIGVCLCMCRVVDVVDVVDVVGSVGRERVVIHYMM